MAVIFSTVIPKSCANAVVSIDPTCPDVLSGVLNHITNRTEAACSETVMSVALFPSACVRLETKGSIWNVSTVPAATTMDCTIIIADVAGAIGGIEGGG